MTIKVIITGPNGQKAEHLADVRRAEDQTAAFTDALSRYRSLHPFAPRFQHMIEVEMSDRAIAGAGEIR